MADDREGADITAADMLPPQEEPSNIQQFYSGSSIFITGASGFLGQLLLEKLLRSCPTITHIYILMRAKNGKTAQQRFDTILNDVLLVRLHLEQPMFYERMTVLEGDCEYSNLGLVESDLELIRSKVDIVFHVAACVRFDVDLRKAINVNVKGTKELLIIAKTINHLRAFVYVSAANSNCIHRQVKEVFYKTPYTSDELINICDTLDDRLLHHITPLLLGNWPNTSSYTKAIAENLIQNDANHLPVTIVRPSIVISTAKEPVSGWCHNYLGVVGVTVASGLGLLHTLQCNPNYIADIIPADYVINTLIAAAWQIGTIQSDNQNEQNANDIKEFEDITCDNSIPIYNIVSSCENPLTWRRYIDLCSTHVVKFPSPLCVGYYHLQLNTNQYIHLLGVLFMHLIPGAIIDGVCWCIGRKPVMLKTYSKIHKLTKDFTYVTCKQWNFQNQNTRALFKKLNKTDQRLFDFDMGGMNWNAYFYTFVRGARVYLLKDPLETIPQGRAKYLKLKIAHYSIISLLILFILKCIFLFLYFF